MSEPQMWLLFGPYWKLPVAVTWTAEDVACVNPHPQLTWLKLWREAVAGKLGPAAFNNTEEGWFLLGPTLRRLATPCQPGVDPEKLVRWHPDEVVFELPAERQFLAKGAETAQPIREFLAGFIDHVGPTVFNTVDELEAFYYLLCNYMMVTLISRQKPVPLGWGWLLALPFPPGWVRNVQRLIPHWAKANQDRLCHTLLHPSVRAMHAPAKNGERLRVEVLTEGSWTETCRLAESEFLRRYGKARYRAAIDERLKRMLPWVLRAFTQQTTESRKQSLATLYPTLEGEFSPRSEQTKAALGRRRLRATRAAAPQPSRPASWSGPVAAANASVPEMPNIQQETEDLRDAWRDVD